MVRLWLWGFTGVLATAFVVSHTFAAVAATASPISAQEWLDTIRVPLRNEGPQVTCAGVGMIAFEPGKTELSADGRRDLDALAAALTSADLVASKFLMLWLARAGETGLAEQRADVIEAGLRSRPALAPGRLTIQPASAAFEGCSQSPAANEILLQIKIAGRWWGEQ